MSTKFSKIIRSYLQGLPRRKLHDVLYVADELVLNDEIPSRVAMLVRDLISYRNRVHVAEYSGSCKKQLRKEVFLMYTSTIKALI